MDIFPNELLKISQTCEQHDECFSSFCGLHECLCCSKCINDSHEKCETLNPLDDVVRGIKSSNVLLECQENLTEVHENISSLIRNRSQNLLSLKNDRERIKSEIREAKQRVVRQLDNLETELLNELSSVEETENAKIQSVILMLEQLEKETKNMKIELLRIKEHSSELQTFLAMKKVESMTTAEYKTIEQFCSTGDLNKSHLTVEFDDFFEFIDKNIPPLGRVSIKFRSNSTVLQKTKDKQAQIHVRPSVRPIEDIHLDLVQSVNLERNYLWGCCFLPDGRYAVTCNRCIILLHGDGVVDCQIDTRPYAVVDVIHIPSTNTLVATTGVYGKKAINFIDIETKEIVRSIDLLPWNYGIVYKGGELIYCSEGWGICKMNIDSEEVTTIKEISNMSAFSYITSYRNSLYYTNNDEFTVSCCGMDGALKWEFKNRVLSYPRGICVDGHGNVYVLGSSWNYNLVVISADGTSHRQLLSDEDGLDTPTAIDYDPYNNQLLITNEFNNVFIYKLR